MNEVAHLRAVAAELSTAADEIPDAEGTITQRPEVQHGIKLAASLAEVGRDLDGIIAGMASEIQTLIADRDSYRHGQEAAKQESALLRRSLAEQTERADYFERRFNETKAALEHVNQYVEHALYGVRHSGAERPEVENAAEVDPVPKTGGPWRNVRPVPAAQDITQFAPTRMRR